MALLLAMGFSQVRGATIPAFTEAHCTECHDAETKKGGLDLEHVSSELSREEVLGRTPLDTQALWGGKDFHPPWEVVAASLAWIVERGDGLQALNLATLLGLVLASVGAEVGVAQGWHALILCQAIPGLVLHAVDVWEPYDGYREYLGRIERYGRNECDVGPRIVPNRVCRRHQCLPIRPAVIFSIPIAGRDIVRD